MPWGESPRRLSPLSFLVGPVREATGLLAVATGGLIFGNLSTGLLIAFGGVVMSIAAHAVRWATFVYIVHDDRIELRRELIRRSVKTIPLDRVRGVDINAPPLHRLLRLAVVHVDAAAGGGEGKDEGRLDAVTIQEAERLRAMLLRRPPTAVSPDRPVAEEPSPEEEAEVLTRAAVRWYFYAPLSGAFLLTPFALVGSLIGFVFSIGDDLGLLTGERVESVGRAVLDLPVVIGIAVLALLVIAVPVLAVVAFAVMNWNFTLRTREGSLVAERGLITRRSVSLERRRIRGVELIDNPLERATRVGHLNALVTGLGDARTRGQLLPASPQPVAWAVAGRVLGTPFERPLIAHPPAARSRRLVRAVVPWLVIAALAAVVGVAWAAWACLGLALAGIPLGVDRYRQLGHATDDTRMSVRSGSLRRRRIVIEHRAVVGWRIRQTLFQRRLGLATLIGGVGAGEGGYPAIDLAESDAVALAQQISPMWVAPFMLKSPEPEPLEPPEPQERS